MKEQAENHGAGQGLAASLAVILTAIGKIMAMPLHVELRGTLRKRGKGSTTASVYITHPRREGAVGKGSLNKDIVLTEALWMRGRGSDRGIDRRECSASKYPEQLTAGERCWERV